MKNILPLPLSGFLIPLFTTLTTVEDCKETKGDYGLLTVRCINTTIPDMPNKFSKGIEVIEFRHSTISTLTPKSFSIYPSIKTLDFQHTKIENISDKAFLLPLKVLKTVYVTDLGNIEIPHFPDWILPTTVQFILYTNASLKTISFADKDLPRLDLLNLANNLLTSIPVMKSTSSIHTLTLSGNPNIVVTVEDIFPFCNLRYLWIDSLVHTATQFTNEWTICHCLRLKTFIEQQLVINDFTYILCGNVTDENCSFNFDKKYKKDEGKCLPPIFNFLNTSNSEPDDQPMVPEERSNTWLIKAFSILFLLFLLIVTIFTIFVCLWRNKSEKKNQLESVQDTVLEDVGKESFSNEDQTLT